jgi:hypothetical protein
MPRKERGEAAYLADMLKFAREVHIHAGTFLF